MFTQRPTGLAPSAVELWESGLPDTQIRAGDLWVLSWDGATVGHALIAAVKDDYVVVFPVSTPDEPSFAPGLIVHSTPLGVPLTVWSTRETGIGNYLLDRSLGQLLAPERIHALTQAIERDTDPGLPPAVGSASDPGNESADHALVDHWTELCFNDGGLPDIHYLDASKVKAAGADSRTTFELLSLPKSEFAEVWKGVSAVSDSQLEVIARSLKVDPDDLLGADPLRGMVKHLSSPRFKRQIRERMAEVRMDEAGFRRAVRADFALAARDDSDELLTQKLRDAIQRVGR
jgi:hypothetical protein